MSQICQIFAYCKSNGQVCKDLQQPPRIHVLNTNIITAALGIGNPKKLMIFTWFRYAVRFLE